jgi:hypothetical protein
MNTKPAILGQKIYKKSGFIECWNLDVVDMDVQLWMCKHMDVQLYSRIKENDKIISR